MFSSMTFTCSAMSLVQSSKGISSKRRKNKTSTCLDSTPSLNARVSQWKKWWIIWRRITKRTRIDKRSLTNSSNSVRKFSNHQVSLNPGQLTLRYSPRSTKTSEWWSQLRTSQSERRSLKPSLRPASPLWPKAVKLTKTWRNRSLWRGESLKKAKKKSWKTMKGDDLSHFARVLKLLLTGRTLIKLTLMNFSQTTCHRKQLS